VWIVLFAIYIIHDSSDKFEDHARLLQRLQSSNIPVPEVYAFSDSQSELGARYLLMEGICGIKAEAEYFIFGIPDRYWKHVLDQLADILAEGMLFTSPTFIVDGHEYNSDTAFWIDTSQSCVAAAWGRIEVHLELLREMRYKEFFERAREEINIIFAESLYLSTDLVLCRYNGYMNTCGPFPTCLPPLQRDNIIFDEEYNIKGVIGFRGTQSVSLWKYFQYPMALEESFEDKAMDGTVGRMRNIFDNSWDQAMNRRRLHWYERDNKSGAHWRCPDKVGLLYQFRTAPPNQRAQLTQSLFSRFYGHNAPSIEVLFHASLMGFFCEWSADAPRGSELALSVVRRMLYRSSQELEQLALAGQSLVEGTLDSQALNLLKIQLLR